MTSLFTVTSRTSKYKTNKEIALFNEIPQPPQQRRVRKGSVQSNKGEAWFITTGHTKAADTPGVA